MTNSEKPQKSSLIIAVVGCIALAVGLGLFFSCNGSNSLAALPAPELSEGTRGTDYGIDKNINEQTIDNYLGRSDTVYRLMLPFEDTATWENKGGTRNIEYYISGFEVVPYPYLTEFPEAYVAQKESENVHGLYDGVTLFSLDENENYVANYEESMDILEALFPKDKNIILMCGAGGYANFTKKMLVALGWDESKIYNAGGIWFYDGENKIDVKYTSNSGDTSYAFWKIPYHQIDFSVLHEVEN